MRHWSIIVTVATLSKLHMWHLVMIKKKTNVFANMWICFYLWKDESISLWYWCWTVMGISTWYQGEIVLSVATSLFIFHHFLPWEHRLCNGNLNDLTVPFPLWSARSSRGVSCVKVFWTDFHCTAFWRQVLCCKRLFIKLFYLLYQS